MKKFALFSLLSLVVVALLLGLTWQAEAKGNRIEDLTAYEYDCAIPSTFNPTFSGNTMRIRDYIHVNINESASPYLHGINTTVANAEINLVKGTTSIRGTMFLEPEAYDGAWQGHWVFIANKGTVFGWAVAHGTGELKGMTLFMNLYDAPVADDAVEKCATVSYDGEPGVPEEGFTNVEGYILLSGLSPVREDGR